MPQAAKALMLSALIKNVYKGKTALESLCEEKLDLPNFTPPPPKKSRGETREALLALIHYSWMEEYFTKLPASLKPYMATALADSQAEALGIKKALLQPQIKSFFVKELFEASVTGDILPFSLLAPSVLDPLLFMSKPRLVNLIDLLGIQDLALDFKKVLARQEIDQLMGLLSPLQKQYFAYCMKESLVPMQQAKAPAFWLKADSTRVLIHAAGLWRLARLIAFEEASWCWYLTHYLDKGRGLQLQNWIEQDKEIALQGKARDLVLLQVVRLMGAIK